MTSEPVVLPVPLPYLRSPNQSARSAGVVPYLIVLHRPVGAYGPSVKWLRDPDAKASAHIITEGNRTGVDVATQLVPWDRKAWACASFNSASYNIEVDDDAWDGDDPHALDVAARIAAWLCYKTGIPPRWARNPMNDPGLAFHADLGRAGGNHSDPTSDPKVRARFLAAVVREARRGGFRDKWGRGALKRIDF